MSLSPAARQDEAERLLDETAEMVVLVQSGLVLFPSEVADPEQMLNRIRKGVLPEAEEIQRFLTFLWQVERMVDFIRDSEAPQLLERCLDFAAMDGLISLYNATFSSDGVIKPTASALLMELESRISSLRQRIHQKAEEMLGREDMADRLQDSYVTVRNDRLVLPIKAEYKNSFNGIIHGISGSDKTVFMEPQELVKENNILQEAVAERDEEVHRLMRQAAHAAISHESDILRDYGIIGRIDFVCARTALSAMLHGVRPGFSSGGPVRMLGIRHPLMELSGGKPVANDLLMQEGEKTLIISGPNAGGKTVMLKSIGLCNLLAGCGIFPPVAPGTEFPFAVKLFAIAGDEQSIADGESTFTAQLGGMKDAISGAAPGTWVIVDEILNGTDPSQAAALAEAMLDYLAQKECHTFVSTHLPGLKITAQENPAMVNAAMGFGADNRPTFRLTKGHPGVSHPLDVAASVGIPEGILKNARAKLSDTQDRYQTALLDLQKKADEMDKALAEYSAREARVRQMEAELSAKLAEAESLKNEFERDKRRKLKDEIAKAREEVLEMVRQAHDGEAKAKADIAQKLKEMENALVEEIHRPDSVPLESVKEGEHVWVVPLDRKAQLVRFADDGKVEVLCGGARMMLSRKDVLGMKEKEAASKPKQARAVGRE